MDTDNSVMIAGIVKSICQEVSGKVFETYEKLQETFDKIWSDKIIRLNSSLEQELFLPPPSLLHNNAAQIFKKKYLIPKFKLVIIGELVCWKIKSNVNLEHFLSEFIIHNLEVPEVDIISPTRYKNLLYAMHSVLTDAYALPNDCHMKHQIIRDAKVSLKSQGFEVIEFNGTNYDVFEVKEDINCATPTMVSATLRNSETNVIFRKGVIFIPDNN